uniref:M20/M25/M40 family metallo-hydrolase n=1 Tax=Lactococcus petauri TaxID=1940789 RepID=UPI00254BF2B9
MEEKQKINILKDIVAIDTQDKNEKNVANYLSSLFKEYGINSQNIKVSKGRDNLLASFGEGEKVLGLTGHMDVVSVGEKADWSHDPFDMYEKDGRLYGRGTSDMKSGLAALAIAMIEIKESGEKLNGQVKFLTTVDEEKNETGAEKFVQLREISELDALIVAEPSGVSKKSIENNIEKLSYSTHKINALLKNNKTDEQHFLIYAHNGSYDYKVNSIGKTAHSSMPQLGVNAITNLIKFYNKQEEYFANNQLIDEILGKIVPVTTLISGGEQINSIPSLASLTGRIRTTPTHTGETITQDLKVIIDDLNQNQGTHLELEVINNKFPVKSDPKSPFIQLVKESGSKYLKQDYPLMHVAGGTDAATFLKGNPNMQVAVIGPGNNTSHMKDEYVRKDIFLRCIDLYKD